MVMEKEWYVLKRGGVMREGECKGAGIMQRAGRFEWKNGVIMEKDDTMWG